MDYFGPQAIESRPARSRSAFCRPMPDRHPRLWHLAKTLAEYASGGWGASPRGSGDAESSLARVRCRALSVTQIRCEVHDSPSQNALRFFTFPAADARNSEQRGRSLLIPYGRWRVADVAQVPLAAAIEVLQVSTRPHRRRPTRFGKRIPRYPGPIGRPAQVGGAWFACTTLPSRSPRRSRRFIRTRRQRSRLPRSP
jgi:hypothetical protein